jgi:hypothetical protein
MIRQQRKSSENRMAIDSTSENSQTAVHFWGMPEMLTFWGQLSKTEFMKT